MVCRFRVVPKKKCYHCEVQGVTFSNEFKLTLLGSMYVCSKFNSNFYTFNLSVTFFLCVLFTMFLSLFAHTHVMMKIEFFYLLLLIPTTNHSFCLSLTHNATLFIHFRCLGMFRRIQSN